MKTRYVIVAGLLLFAGVYALYYFVQQRSATIVLYNAVVYTVDPQRPTAQAIAIRGNTIVGVGTTEEIRSGFRSGREIDVKGMPVYPGFTDAHAHLESLGALLVNLNLYGTKSVEEIRARAAERVAELPEGAWLRGRSWDQNDWPEKAFPTHQMLDDITGDHPAYLVRIDGHAAWVNKRALQLANVTRDTPDPPGGSIIRDDGGNPTGVLIDNAMDLVNSIVPAPSREERVEAVKTAIEECLSVGLTAVHDMGVDDELIGIYKSLIEQGAFPFRVSAAIGGTGSTWSRYLQRGPEVGTGGGRLTVRALKLYADGALGSRGAALIEPYEDDPGNRGLTVTSADELKAAAADALRRGFQVCTHAIGDRANHIVLNVYEEVFRGNTDGKNSRFRVEHAQLVDRADIGRFKPLGVLPSMQPTHCTSDMYWAEKRVGPERIKGAYAWRSLLDAGNIIPGGSDFPVEAPPPLYGFYAAITRQDHEQWPEGGWYPEERMTREEALKAFTIWAAYAAFEEKVRGTISVGKLADIVVLSNDIMTCDPVDILSTKVLYTLVDGEIVYSSAEGDKR